MVNPNCILIRAMNSSLWIAVLVVHVGCIIEAQPSKSPTSSLVSSSASLNDEKESTFELLPAASISAAYSSRQNNFGRTNLVQRPYSRGRKFISSTTTTSPKQLSIMSTTEAYEDDSCTGKLDGYFQNFGSSCTSYYFCAAGYQITYVCPQGEKFTGSRCDEEYQCPIKQGHVNLCADAPNGYYSNARSPGKYFYCFQKAKVIDLQCDLGKVFIGDKCVFSKEVDQSTSTKSQDSSNEDYSSSCMTKSNGFHPDKQTGCKKYFYCINGDKTDLSCQSGFLFNGDICVHTSRFSCPYSSSRIVSTSTTEQKAIGQEGNDISSKEKSSSGNPTRTTDRNVQSPTFETTTTDGSIRTG